MKYYNRYKIVEPYFQDDWQVTNRLTLNLGLRLSLFGTTAKSRIRRSTLIRRTTRLESRRSTGRTAVANNLFINGFRTGLCSAV